MPRVTHFEIHASDPQKAVQFYSSVFGWTCRHIETIDYWIVDTERGNEAGINGGIVRRRGPGPQEMQAVNAFVCTVDVPSVDQYFDKALKAGASVAMPKTAIPGVGYIAYVKDPDGNILGLHQADAKAK